MKIHGNITYKDGRNAVKASVILLKRIRHHKRFRYMQVERQYTNQQGEYAFDIAIDDAAYYKIIVLQ